MSATSTSTCSDTFVTRLRDRGVPLDRIRELLGHKTMVMTLRYAKVRPVQLKEAIAALDERENSWICGES